MGYERASAWFFRTASGPVPDSERTGKSRIDLFRPSLGGRAGG